jgi:hypothetical protein
MKLKLIFTELILTQWVKYYFFKKKLDIYVFFYVFFLYKKFLNINQKTYELI